MDRYIPRHSVDKSIKLTDGALKTHLSVRQEVVLSALKVLHLSCGLDSWRSSGGHKMAGTRTGREEGRVRCGQ
jgi:hypothetical protein